VTPRQQRVDNPIAKRVATQPQMFAIGAANENGICYRMPPGATIHGRPRPLSEVVCTP
jgi:hypothetical protein